MKSIKQNTLFILLISFSINGHTQIPNKSQEVRGLYGSYVSLVKKGNQFQYFSEQVDKRVGKSLPRYGVRATRCGGKIKKDNTCPGITLYTGGNAQSVRFSKVVGPNKQIDDLNGHPERLLTRLAVRFSKKDNRYYAISYVSKSYSPIDGKVIPALWRSRTSNPNGKWEYVGKLKDERGREIARKGSGMTFIVNDNYSSRRDDINPMNNKFIHYLEDGKKLFIAYSQDGLEWRYYRKNGKLVNVRPSRYSSDPSWIFNSGVKTKHGYFMFVSLGWYPLAHRMLYSKDGINWEQIKYFGNGSRVAGVRVGYNYLKNASLSYDNSSDRLYLIMTTSGTKHTKRVASMTAKSITPAKYLNAKAPKVKKPVVKAVPPKTKAPKVKKPSQKSPPVLNPRVKTPWARTNPRYPYLNTRFSIR